jgi:dipeptidyl aminopeptidase/acylaminoacyl peptidase
MWLGVASGGNEKTQLWFVDSDGSDLRPIAVDDNVIHNPGDWSRDGRYISYTSNERDARYFDVYVFDTRSGESKRIFQRDENMSAHKFSPNGKYLLVGVNHSNVDNDEYIVATDGSGSALLTPHTGEAQYGSFVWRGNSQLLFCCNEGREFLNIAALDLGVIPYELAKLAVKPENKIWTQEVPRDIDSLSISDDARWLGWSENDNGFGVAHLGDLSKIVGGKLTELPISGVIPRGLQTVGRFSPDSRSVILQSIGPEGPTDLWRYDLEANVCSRLTWASLGGIPTNTYVVPEVKSFASFDGTLVSGLWYAPRGEKPAAGWPVILVAHGGPEGQARPYFDPQIQLYLSLGCAVFELNPRGSSGYGKTYMTLDNVGKREDSVHDYAFARDWLVEQQLADASRIAISGGSYGGYVVLGALTLYPDKWAAGVDNVGISNFVTFLENTGPYRRAIREAEYGSLTTDRETLIRISPIHKVSRITAPLLIIHGTNDPRVPVNEAQQMHDALKAQGREVDLLVFADEGHGVAKLENRAIAWQRELEFLKKHLQLQ